MNCPRFLKTLSIDEFLENLFGYFEYKLDFRNIVWLNYNFAQKKSQKSISNNAQWNVFKYHSKDFVFYRPSEAYHFHLFYRSFEPIKKNQDGTYNINFIINYNSKVQGYIIFDHLQIEEVFLFFNEVNSFLKSITEQLYYCIKFAELKERTYKDDVTHFFNQRFLNEHLESLMKIHRTQKKEMSVLFVDLDHFKFINDNFGHVVGSQLLAEIARLIDTHMSMHDIGVRYGGDEFVVLLPHKGEKEAHIFAERIRTLIESTDFIINAQSIRITASIGLASYPKHAANSEQILKIADQAMYDAKAKSRNTVYIAS